MNPMQQIPPKCGACSKLIIDRYKMQINNGEFYHEMCLQCSICGTHLTQKCFARDSKLYCKYDYYRLFMNCLGCSEKILAKELVMRASDYIFHLRCFACVVCGAPLQKGDQYVIRQGQLFCRPDYEKEVEMMNEYQASEYPFDDMALSSRSHDGRRGPKRPRTILTTQQRRAFKASFEISPKPSRKVRELLAKDTGLSVRIVQVWFQNQRAKMKKIQKKAKIENKSVNQSLLNNNSNGSDSDCTSNDKIDIKEEKNRENTNIHNMQNYCDSPSCSDNEHSLYSKSVPLSKDMADQDSRTGMPYYKLPYIDGLNQFCFPTNLDTLESDDKNLNFLSMPTNSINRGYNTNNNNINNMSAPARLNDLTSVVASNTTPIDRLYSMNATYFREDQSMLIDARNSTSPSHDYSY